MGPRRKYDREFKLHADQLSQQDGVSISEVACELGINVKRLYRWRAEAQQAGTGAFFSCSGPFWQIHSRVKHDR